MTAGKDNALGESVFNGQPGHAVLHNEERDQVNYLTEQLRAVIDGDTGELSTALSASYVLEGSAFADLGKQVGVDSTGVTECASAISTALAGFLALGVRAYAKGTFKTASTVTIAGDADFSDAVFNYTAATGTAIRVGTNTSGAWIENLHVRLPKVNATAKTTTGWSQVAGTIGVDVVNLYSSTVDIPFIGAFETNLRLYGKGKGCVYNTVILGQVYNGKINQLLSADSTGWCNQNVFIGGRLQHESGEGTNVSGTRQIEMAVCTNAINNNTWLGTCVEGDTAEFHAIVAGQVNLLDNCRWEVTGGARVEYASDSTQNEIRGGYGSEFIVETFASGATGSNDRHSPNRSYRTGSGGTKGVWVLENQSGGSNPADIIMDAGARLAGSDPSTAYTVSRAATMTKMKRAADTYPRLQFDHQNGRVYFADASGTPTSYLSAFSSLSIWQVNGASVAFNADNTYDLGIASYRPRDLRLGRDAIIGGALDHDGTTVGFYGTTPVTQPAANADTSGASLADLETEVNQLKALLRSVGLMAP